MRKGFFTMAGFLYQKLQAGERRPSYTLSDYDINTVVGTALLIADDQYAPPVKVIGGSGDSKEYEDPSKLWTPKDHASLNNKRRSIGAKVEKEFEATQSKDVLDLVKQANEEPWRKNWTDEQRKAIQDYRNAQSEYYSEHFNNDLIRDKTFQRLIKKRLQGQADDRVNELFDLIDLINAEPPKKKAPAKKAKAKPQQDAE